MLSIQQSTTQYGSRLPRSIAIKLKRQKTIQKVQFSRYNAVKNIDVYESIPENYPQNIKCRSPIKEVIFAGDALLAVTSSGIARAYNLYSGTLLSNLNPTPNDSVQTVVYNRYNNTLIVVYAAQPGQLQCVVYTLEALMNGKTRETQSGHSFGTVILRHPGFFEFDDVNGRIGAAILHEQRYQFWDMGSYTKAFEINGHGDKYHEMRVSDGLLAMFKLPTGGFIPVSLFNIKDGQRLVTDATIEIDPHRDMVLLELCCEYLLLKQKGSCLRIFDLLRNNLQKVKGTRHFHPIGFVFYDYSQNNKKTGLLLNQTKQFMTISSNVLEFWELSNFQVTLFRKIHIPGLVGPELVSHNIYSNIVAAYTTAASDSDELSIPSIFQSARDFFSIHKEEISAKQSPTFTTYSFMSSQFSTTSCVDLLAPSKNDVKPVTGVHLFDMLDGECLGIVEQFDDNVKVLSNALDKNTLAAGCFNGTIRLARIPTAYDTQPSNNLEENQSSQPFQGLMSLYLPPSPNYNEKIRRKTIIRNSHTTLNQHGNNQDTPEINSLECLYSEHEENGYSATFLIGRKNEKRLRYAEYENDSKINKKTK